jgi:dipeptidyl aminopeptidase/acylaminoacyl peptidase
MAATDAPSAAAGVDTPASDPGYSTEEVRFHSGRDVLAGTLMLPAVRSGPVPAVAQGPGWMGLRSAKVYRPYHRALLAAGIGVLTFDYRGFGDSGGDATYLDPMTQVADWRAATTYLETREEVDGDRLGAFGTGGSGGGNAVYAGGLDPRVKAVVSQVPVADGRDWLHRMRREYEWLELLAQIREANRRHATTGEPTLVAPREGIMVATPERKASTLKADVDDRVPQQVDVRSAEAIFAYRPIDVVDRIAPRALMLIAVENDATTPEDHAYALYERAGGPKRLVIQTGTSHYAAYEQYRDVVNPMIVDWFTRYLVKGEVLVHERPAEAEILRLDRPSR